MKITHLTTVHKYDDTRIFLKECQTLKDAGYEVSIIASQVKEGIYNGINVYSLDKRYKNRFDRIIRGRKAILKKALELDSDIYHFHDPELIPVGKKLKRYGKIVIYDVHEDVPRQIFNKHWIPKIFRGLISYLYEKYELRSSTKFDGIVTATPHIRNRFLKVKQNVVCVCNYPIINELYPNNQFNKKNSVVYIGGITEERGSVTMVNAIKKTNATLYLAGKFVNEIEEKKITSSNEYGNQIHFFGFLGRGEIRNILSQSKAGLVVLQPRPNFLESLPIKMFEYMSAGICVIASDFPLWKEIVEKNKCGICVDPLNINEISRAIQWVIDNPKKAKKMGENGRKAILNKYNWENEGRKLIKFYNDIKKDKGA